MRERFGWNSIDGSHEFDVAGLGSQVLNVAGSESFQQENNLAGNRKSVFWFANFYRAG